MDDTLLVEAHPALAGHVMSVAEDASSPAADVECEFSTAPGFTPQHLLDGDLPDIPRADLAALLVRQLRQLATVEASLDLALGAGLERMKARGWFTRHGASTFGSYATSVLGFSSVHASEVVRLASRLEKLPVLRAAFTGGLVGRSRLRVVLPRATPEHDAALAGLCRTRSVRQLAALVREGALSPGSPPPAPSVEELEQAEAMGTLALSMTPSERAQVMGWGRTMIRAVLGGDAPAWQCLEALAADTLAALGPEHHRSEGPDDSCDGSARGDHAGSAAHSSGREVPRGCACAGTRGGACAEAVDATAHSSGREVPEACGCAGRANEGTRGGACAEAVDAAAHARGRKAPDGCACAGRATDGTRGGACAEAVGTAAGSSGREAPGRCACGTSRRRRRRSRRARLDLAAARKRARKDLLRRLDALPIARLPDVARAHDPDSLDEALRDLVRLRRTVECERALLLLWFHRRRLHVELGHRNFTDFVEHRLGLSPREATEALELQSKLLLRCSKLAEAFRRGELPAHVVSVLRLVVRRETEDEWIAHARRCSWKRLLLEVDVLLALRGSLAAPQWEQVTNGGRPLAHVDLPGLQLDFQQALGQRERRRRRKAERVLAGRRGAANLRSGAPEVCMRQELDPDEDSDPDAAERTATWSRTTLVRLDCPAAVAKLVREAIEAVKRKVGLALSDGSALVLMLREFLVTYSGDPTVREDALKLAILERDGWQCSLPHCRQRSGLEVHHVVYRSHQGLDEPWNLVTLCGPCHRHLQHAGRVRIEGRAPETLTVTWGEGPRRQRWRHGLRAA